MHDPGHESNRATGLQHKVALSLHPGPLQKPEQAGLDMRGQEATRRDVGGGREGGEEEEAALP